MIETESLIIAAVITVLRDSEKADDPDDAICLREVACRTLEGLIQKAQTKESFRLELIFNEGNLSSTRMLGGIT